MARGNSWSHCPATSQSTSHAHNFFGPRIIPQMTLTLRWRATIGLRAPFPEVPRSLFAKVRLHRLPSLYKPRRKRSLTRLETIGFPRLRLPFQYRGTEDPL